MSTFGLISVCVRSVPRAENEKMSTERGLTAQAQGRRHKAKVSAPRLRSFDGFHKPRFHLTQRALWRRRYGDFPYFGLILRRRCRYPAIFCSHRLRLFRNHRRCCLSKLCNRVCFINAIQLGRRVPQGLKPAFFPAQTARLQPCPTQKPIYETRSSKHAQDLSRSPELNRAELR